MAAATGMASQRVCAKMLEFVFGRSIATKSLEEVGIVFSNGLGIQKLYGQSSRNSRSHCRKCQPNGGEKFFVVEWLGEKSRCPGFQRGGTDERIVFSGKHDDARRRRKVPHTRLYLESVHERHPNINDGDCRSMNLHVTQKRVRIAELFGVPTCRHEKPIEPSQHGRIIIEETDRTWAWSMQNKSILRRHPTRPY